MANIADIIKYEGDNSTFIWKHPCEDFNTTTQLIVHESQEAIFFLNGQALDLFGPGRHTLETQNIPLLRRIINIPTGGESPFHCEVYFINKTERMAIRWGTDSKVQYVEPTYKFPISIGASGEMALSVNDSRKLLVKLVGTERVLDRQQLTTYFRSILMTKVKTYMAQTMRANAINIFEIDESLETFSADIKERLIPDFLDYGVDLKRFSNMGIGLGMMAGVGGTVGGMVGDVVSDAFAGMSAVQPQTAVNKFCDQCGAELTPGAAFCDECGAPQAPADTCVKCGFKFIKPGKFCPKCGTRREG